jgi:NOL1/NOP2/sun family putative RNA methylase
MADPKVPIPDLFRERYESLSDDPEAFFQSLVTPLPRTCRVNTHKGNVEAVCDRFDKYCFKYERVPWYGDALVTGDQPLGSTFEHFFGAIYIQDLASMLPPLVVREELKSAELVLDACAAPGSKSTQLSAIMENRGTIIANDSDHQRIKALKFNMEKTGSVNIAITNYDLRKFPDLRFDVILLDAPCSSEGTVRKVPGVFKWWHLRHIYSSAGVQRQLIVKAFDLLADGGVLLYSTCTFAPEENEGIIQHLLKERNEASLEPISTAHFRTTAGVTQFRGVEFDERVTNTVRVFPHHNETGGFFMARIRK